MNKIVDFALSKTRTTLAIAILVLIAGSYSRSMIPVAADPSITLPFVSVSIFLDGASPEDASRLIAKPVENRLRSDCVRIMMTGRVHKLSARVTECLRALGITETCFHELVFKKGNSDTFEYKCDELRRMMRVYRPRKVRIWEDRVRHAEGFREFGKREFSEVEFEINLVEPSNDY